MIGRLNVGIDPGSKKSAFVSIDNNLKIQYFGYELNADVLAEIPSMKGHIAIEDVTPRRQPFGHVICDLAFWCGAFYGASLKGVATDVYLVQEGKLRSWLCGQTKGVRDSHVRTEVLRVYGGKESAVGTRQEPGPLYRMLKKSIPKDRGHLLSALSLALWAKHSQKVGFHFEGVTRVWNG